MGVEEAEVSILRKGGRIAVAAETRKPSSK